MHRTNSTTQCHCRVRLTLREQAARLLVCCSHGDKKRTALLVLKLQLHLASCDSLTFHVQQDLFHVLKSMHNRLQCCLQYSRQASSPAQHTFKLLVAGSASQYFTLKRISYNDSPRTDCWTSCEVKSHITAHVQKQQQCIQQADSCIVTHIMVH